MQLTYSLLDFVIPTCQDTVHVYIYIDLVAPRCELDVDKCVNGECTCKVGYLPQDCCDCAYGYYKDKEDGKCKCKI